jgi:arginine:ornithine antiporter / lysine permease
MILRGIKEAAFINTVATIAKIVPILVFVLFMALAFDSELFRASFWGGGAYTAGDVFNQVRSTMLVTVFVFIGVEGAPAFTPVTPRPELMSASPR